MQRAKIVTRSGKRMLCLPDSLDIRDGEIFLQQVGGMVVLIPKNSDGEAFGTDLAGLPIVDMLEIDGGPSEEASSSGLDAAGLPLMGASREPEVPAS